MLLLMTAAVLTASCPAAAETAAGPDRSPAAQQEAISPYWIVLTVPGGWTSNNGAAVRVSITDRENLGWYRIEYRMNDSNWIDCEDRFDQNEAEITVHENGLFTVRITDPRGNTFEETAEVNTIDTAAPSVTAEVRGQTLHITARDELSGLAGVQVNSMLFTTVDGGILDVDLDRNMNRFERLAVRAFDFAGNFSEPIALENPHYVEAVEPTPKPAATATPAPAQTPESTQAAESIPTATPTPTQAEAHGLGSTLIYVQDDTVPQVTSTPTAAPTAAPVASPTPEIIVQTEYITIGPGMPFQTDGNAHTLDLLYSAATNKQFITIETKAGNTFYLVIDYDKPVDEDAEMYETYFLNLVDERDLLALMSDEEKEEMPTPTPEIVYVTPEPVTAADPGETAKAQAEKPNQTTALIGLVGIIALVGIGAFLLRKNKGKAAKPKADNDFDLDDDDEPDDESLSGNEDA